MAAGLGFKTFNTGDVLTANDTNGYLMQGVWVFANAAARTAAVTSPQEGNVSYLKDTDSLEIYSGSAWVAYGSGDITGVTAGTGLSGGGASGSVTLSIATQQADLIVKGFEEDVNVVASAATGTINFDVATASIWYYTSNATANHTLNFRYDSSNTLSSKLAVGDAITLVWMNTNGTTAYYPSTIQIDGNTVTPKVPAAISAGNASAIDAYTFTIIKTAATPTYTVLETQTKFA